MGGLRLMHKLSHNILSFDQINSLNSLPIHGLCTLRSMATSLPIVYFLHFACVGVIFLLN